MEPCPPWLCFGEGENEFRLTGSFSTASSCFLPHFFPHVFTNIKDEIWGGVRGERRMRGIKAVDECEERLDLFFIEPISGF